MLVCESAGATAADLAQLGDFMALIAPTLEFAAGLRR